MSELEIGYILALSFFIVFMVGLIFWNAYKVIKYLIETIVNLHDLGR
tara:strand:+ start:5840 stop:5980 length:141 start_codon:yes stop_codon:yes gene_type:complete